VGKAFAAGVFIFVAVCGRVAAENAGINVSYALAKTTFLSTETAELKMTVVNHTAQEVRIFARGVEFTTYSGGLFRLLLGSCSASCFWHLSVAPGKTGSWSIPLPSCEVLSDGCTVQIGVKYYLEYAGGEETRSTTLPPYHFVADPNVTYESVPDGLPVYVALGQLSGSIVPNTVLIAVTAAAAERVRFAPNPTPFIHEVETVVRDTGLTVRYTSDAGMHDPEPCGLPALDDSASWQAQVYVKYAPDQTEAIDHALDAIRQHFGSRVCAVTGGFVFNARTDYPYEWDRAADDARSNAQRLVETVGGGSLGFFPLTRDVAGISYPDARNVLFSPDELDGAQADLLDPAGGSVSLRVSEQVASAGSQPASFVPSPALVRLAPRAFRFAESVPSLEPTVTIAADQPELYVIGSAWTADSLRMGLSPYFVAVVHAERKALALAEVLGVRLGHDTLFSIYSRPDADTESVGVAARFTGDPKRLASIPADSNVRVVSWQHSEEQRLLPIGLRDRLSTVTEISGAYPHWRPERFRLAVEVDSPSNSATVNARKVVDGIRALPHVIEAAERTSEQGKHARYETVVNSQDPSALDGIVAALRKAYAALHPQITKDLYPFVSDCAGLEKRLLTASIRANLLKALYEARNTNRRLRKLVLAAELPTTSVELCEPLARSTDQLTFTDLSHFGRIPGQLPIEVTTMMVFRTGRRGGPASF
jgi:hypothetical protein